MKPRCAATPGADVAHCQPKPVGAAALVCANLWDRGWLDSCSTLPGRKRRGDEASEVERQRHAAKRQNPLLRRDSMGCRKGAQTALPKADLSARITLELRGAAKRHPLERIVRRPYETERSPGAGMDHL